MEVVKFETFEMKKNETIDKTFTRYKIQCHIDLMMTQ